MVFLMMVGRQVDFETWVKSTNNKSPLKLSFSLPVTNLHFRSVMIHFSVPDPGVCLHIPTILQFVCPSVFSHSRKSYCHCHPLLFLCPSCLVTRGCCLVGVVLVALTVENPAASLHPPTPPDLSYPSPSSQLTVSVITSSLTEQLLGLRARSITCRLGY